MSVNFELVVKSRNDKGKGASRRLRHENKVPGIIYGGGKEPVSVWLDHNELKKSLKNEAFYSHVLNVKLDDQTEKAILRDVQRHPYRPVIMHIDLQRISDNTWLRLSIPLHFVNEDKAPGVKAGGMVSHLMTAVEVACLAKDLPEFIEVDLEALEVNHSVHLSDLKLPAGIELPALAHGAEHDLPVASIHIPHAAAETETTPAEAAAPAAGSTPAA